MGVQSGDVEQSESWLEGLSRLNQVIAKSGDPLEGNLFYEHGDSSFVDRPPDPRLRSKRDRFRSVALSHNRLLEVGVNGGHSAYAALTANPELTYFGIDICAHSYVRPAIEWLQAEFPGRVSFESGNSLKTLPALRRQGQRFSAFHVDGAKVNYLADILHCRQMMDGEVAVVIVDDTNGPLVSVTWRRCLRWRIVAPLAAYPSLDKGGFSNEIAQLLPTRSGMSEAELVAAAVLRAGWKMNQSARRVRRRLLGLDAKKPMP
jgi:methyltransferase family protein